jgi:O-succinylbenzoic acid--CoA ligase
MERENDILGDPFAGERVVFETSGSAGPVKRIVHSCRGLECSAEAVNRHLEVNRGSCWGLALPLHHVGGYGVVARARRAACRLERFDGRWDGLRFRRWLDAVRVTHTSLVPTQVFDLVSAGLDAPPRLRAVVVGGGRLDAATGAEARSLGWPVLASYGLTEAGSQVATAPLASLAEPFREDPLPVLPIWQVRVAEDGRLWLNGSALFRGWLVGSERRFVAREGDWFETTDLAELDPQGRLTPLGRADERVKILGELVDPQAVERQLAALDPGGGWGHQALILAVPEPRAGHRLLAVVEAAAGRRPGEAVAAYNARAAGFARVDQVLDCEGFPRGGLGKVRRRELRDRLARQLSPAPPPDSR